MENPKFKVQNPKLVVGHWLLVIIWLLYLGYCSFDVAWGASITKSSSAEFSTTGAVFEHTKISGETITLKISGGGVWTENGVPVATGTNDQDQISIDGDGSGGAYLAWRNKRNNPFGDIYAAHVDSSGTLHWSTAVATGSVTMETPQIVKSINSSGSVEGAIVVWTAIGTDAANAPSKNIYISKFNSAGKVFSGWQSAVVCNAPKDQDKPQVVSDHLGGAVAVWRDYRDGKSAIYAQRIKYDGSPFWTTNGITVCASSISGTTTNADFPQITYFESNQYAIGWSDKRDSYENIYVQRLNNDGKLGFSENGMAVSTSSNPKDNFSLASAFIPSYSTYIPLFVWRETSGGVQSAYGQLIWGDGRRGFGNTGTQLAAGTVPLCAVAGTISGESIYSWVVGTGSSYESFVQMLNVSGEALWGSAGKNLGTPINIKIVSDGERGAYLAGMSGNYYPCAQRINASGDEVWDENGVLLAPYQYEGEGNFSLSAPESLGPVYAWADSRNGNKDIFVQKVTDLYYPSGTYTTEKIENPDPGFASWGSISWEGTGTITAEVKTAATSSALDSTSWNPATNGGSIPSSGKWIQVRMYLNSSSDRLSSATLSFLSLNYSLDTSFPSIESVRADSQILIPGESCYVSSSPTIEATLTDDRLLSSADIKIDEVSISYSTVSSSDTRWVIRAQPTTPLSVGSHSLKVEVTDDAGNTTRNTYTLAVEAIPRIVGTISFGSSSVPNEIIATYTLTAAAETKIEIRNLLTAELIRSFSRSSITGANEVNIDLSGLSAGAYLLTITPAGGTGVSARFMVP